MSRIILFFDHNLTHLGGQIFPFNDRRFDEFIVVSSEVVIENGECVALLSLEKKVKSFLSNVRSTNPQVCYLEDVVRKIIVKRGKQVGIVRFNIANDSYCFALIIDQKGTILHKRFFRAESKEDIEEELNLTIQVLKLKSAETTEITVKDLLNENFTGVRKRFQSFIASRKLEIRKMKLKRLFEKLSFVAVVLMTMYYFLQDYRISSLQEEIANISAEISKVEQEIKREYYKRVLSLVPKQDVVVIMKKVEILADEKNVVKKIMIDSKGSKVEYEILFESKNPLLDSKNVQLYNIKRGENVAEVVFPEKLADYEVALRKGVAKWLN